VCADPLCRGHWIRHSGLTLSWMTCSTRSP
jgi:hypothetical protein